MITYNPNRQFRCSIIRGKAKGALDNLLPAYAKIIGDLCPCTKNDFEQKFNSKIAEILNDSSDKTLNNHRTEIAGKLFGMYYEDENGMIFASQRTEKFIDDSDQPAFFKDICFKFQFPNGMDKIDKITEKLDHSICIRPFSYILQLLLLAQSENMPITKEDIGYYVLNSLDVLQGKVHCETVLAEIRKDRKDGISRKISQPGKASSFLVQHINEQIAYLELANLIRVIDRQVILNSKEQKTIQLMASFWNQTPEFDVYKYQLHNKDQRKQFYREWQIYYSSLNSQVVFNTSVESLTTQTTQKVFVNTTAIGDEGEIYVFNYEKDRVRMFDPRLLTKVHHVGKTKGLGYDIQSVIAETGEYAEFVKYIEVKSTKRVTAPDINDTTWRDTVNLTRNEWVAAAQHQKFYSIYRVYLTSEGIIIYEIKDPFNKAQNQKIKVIPLTYRLDLSSESIDNVV